MNRVNVATFRLLFNPKERWQDRVWHPTSLTRSRSVNLPAILRTFMTEVIRSKFFSRRQLLSWAPEEIRPWSNIPARSSQVAGCPQDHGQIWNFAITQQRPEEYPISVRTIRSDTTRRQRCGPLQKIRQLLPIGLLAYINREFNRKREGHLLLHEGDKPRDLLERPLHWQSVAIKQICLIQRS